VLRAIPSDAAADPFGARVRWLGHPAFLACVAMLVVNDHVLKARFPGWWTGKLSDVAGFTVISVVLSVVLGPQRGLPVAAASFVGLKTVAGIAELAAPLLGGVTRRDATDLIALVVILPLWRLLGTERDRPARSSATDPSTWHAGWAARGRGVLAAVSPIAGAVFVTAATTATSCAPSPTVTAVTALEQDLYALVDHGVGPPRWARSTDGGRTWQRSESPYNSPETPPSAGVDEEPGPAGPRRACTSDGTCWRLRERRVIERAAAGGRVVEELRLTDAEVAAITNGCNGSVGVLESIAAAEIDGTPHVVASMGAEGVLVRQRDGAWDRVRVLSAPPAEPNRAESTATIALFLYGPPLAVVAWLAGRRRWPSWWVGPVVAVAGWSTTIGVAGAASMFAGPDTDSTRVAGRVAIPCIVVTAVAAIIAARHPARPRPPVAFPPPRPPFPPPPSPPPPPPFPPPPPPPPPPSAPPPPPPAIDEADQGNSPST
jgi:hypothetical protein